MGGAAPSLLGRIEHDKGAHGTCWVFGSMVSIVSVVVGMSGRCALVSLPKCHAGAGGGGKESAAIGCIAAAGGVCVGG